MAVDGKEEKVRALRGALKNGRTAQSSTDLGTDDRNDDPASGANFQDAGRAVERLAANSNRPKRNAGKPGSNQRGPAAKPVRLRPADRRSGESDSSPALDTASSEPDTRVVGRIFADGPVPERVDLDPNTPDGTFDFPVRSDDTHVSLSSKYPASNDILSGNPKISIRKLAAQLGVSNDTAHRIKKEFEETHPVDVKPKEGLKIPTLPKGNTLSKSEVAEYQESFTSSLESDFQTLDQYLWHRQLAVGIDTAQQPIWSNLDTEEIEKLTKIMLKWGQRNEAAAAVVRATVESSDYIAVASIFVPRIKSTVDTYKKTRKPRVRRGQVPHEV